MFGNKLRSWMEAVRPKKNKHRKDKQGKCISSSFSPTPNSHNHIVKFKTPCITHNNENDEETGTNKFKYYNNHEAKKKSGPSSASSNSQILRYSATNLSSPESAYSTGYSTDGTSPGAPPDYTLNNTKQIDNGHVESVDPTRFSSGTILRSPRNFKTANVVTFKGPISSPVQQKNQAILNKQANESEDLKHINGSGHGGIAVDSISLGLMSPRQRNRIRTNPWLPGGTSSTVVSPIPGRQELILTPILTKTLTSQSPKQHRYLNSSTRRRSISSSSASSHSAGSIALDNHVPRSISDEEDCTLNEMMGKYDESYVYEKETDILSDSDPTDCESDIDTGQDGGDEDDAGEAELDFIDNGSYLEYDPRTGGNTGHCSYYVPNEAHKRRSSRRRTARKNKDPVDNKRRRSSSSKKVHNKSDRERRSSGHKDGSKSAGATPLSVRKSSLRPSSKLAQDECLMKKRSNSVCLHRDTITLIDKRDREADLKYRELIGQAEQILRTMNINGLSPRRLPGPANKRVELLRTTECPKTDVLIKNRASEEISVMAISNNVLNKNPSNNFKTTRFSPKKNHITNFIINNSPVLVRKELQNHTLFPSVKTPVKGEMHISPLSARKYESLQNQSVESSMNITTRYFSKLEDGMKNGITSYYPSPMTGKKLHNGQPKSILHKSEYSHHVSSPRHRRINKVYLESSSSEEDYRPKTSMSRSCPQSEPVRRKVYFGRNTIARGYGYGKTVAFNLGNEENLNNNDSGSTENLRQQVLLSTIQSLKKNLEDHSATLQQTYRSTQNMSQF